MPKPLEHTSAKGHAVWVLLRNRTTWQIGVPLVLSFIALMLSCESNRIARSATDAAGRTSLWTELTAFSPDSPFVRDARAAYGGQDGGSYYMIISDHDDALHACFNCEVRNTGPRDALDVVLHLKLDYLVDQTTGARLIYTGNLPVGTIASGQTLVQFFTVGNNPEYGSVPEPMRRVFIDAFDSGELGVKLEMWATYSSSGREDAVGPVYRVAIWYGGRMVVRVPSDRAEITGGVELKSGDEG